MKYYVVVKKKGGKEALLYMERTLRSTAGGIKTRHRKRLMLIFNTHTKTDNTLEDYTRNR